MTEMKVAMWNCSGLLSTSSASEKLDFLGATSSFDLIVLIETHHKHYVDISTFLHTYTTAYNIIHAEATAQDPYAGIVVLLDKSFDLTSSAELIPGRLINFKLKCGSEKFNISVLYGYTGACATVANIERFTDLLVTSHDSSDYNIILGDFNFVEMDLDRTNMRSTGMNQKDSILSRVWTEFASSLDLSDPFRVRNPRRKMFSYIHTQHNAKSRIDRVYTNDENVSNIFHYKHTPTPWPKAHRLVTFSVRANVERGPGYWKMNTSILSDRAFELVLESTIDDVSALNIQDPIERWLIFIQTIRLEAQVYSSRKRYHEKAIKRECERNLELLEQNPVYGKSAHLKTQHEYFTEKLNVWSKKQIEGYQVRIKTQPKFEYCEPKIDFYANLEKKSAKKKLITHLKSDTGETVYHTDGLKAVATDYYSNLFGGKHSDQTTTHRLLRNVNKTVSREDKAKLDRLITREELEKTVMKLRRNKSPGPDGIPAEFYQRYWHLIQNFYFEFITEVKEKGFPAVKNTSVTTLIYKNKGEIDNLAYYRPIALMNVDVKILTKLLSLRLVTILPTVIHESQTAVYGRTIANNVHLVRDIIELANRNDEEAALLFIDQEKAFDRVSHSFLFSALSRFGIGDVFTQWIRLIYANASTRVNVNGYLTEKILLKCGVRQGCPLSALLYVLVIEILALQFRANPNIVGFTIQGENIVSSHYADDTVIKITQNRCFKEVYKELKDFERASGAKINYDKTKGLWLGRWKNRTDDPFDGLYEDENRIKWTSKNVNYLGIYVGNEDPVSITFKEIVPKMKNRMNFWKPLKLPTLAKSRVIEIFHASKLFYAASFYPIPDDIVTEINNCFRGYITFPSKKNMVNKMEMEKLRDFGGLKLINIKLKAECPKIQWLMRLITDDNLRVHRGIFEALMATEKCYLSGYDMIFAETSFIRKSKISNPFYKEALIAISKLNTYKQFDDVNAEHLFYNKIFVTSVDEEVHDRTLAPFRGNRILSTIRTYGDLLRAETALSQPLRAAVRRKKESIEFIREATESHMIIGYDHIEYKFEEMTQKEIYSELLHEQSRDHAYVGKWGAAATFGLIEWGKVWQSLHKQFYTENMKSSIWEQLHLNFYTTYNFNTWFGHLDPCPLCKKIPEEVFHIIVDCKFTKVMWKKAERTLFRIFPKAPTPYEMAFGLQASRKGDAYPTLLRNWITFSLRHFIMLEERRMFKINSESSSWIAPSIEKFMVKFNYNMRQELLAKMLLFDLQGLAEKFKEIVTCNNAVASNVGGVYSWFDIM